MFKYLHNGVNYTLTELKGPSDPLDAANLIIAAPPGGELEDEVDGFIDDRTEVGVCIVQMDSRHQQIVIHFHLTLS
jgi:hypothetical protein